MITLVNKNPVKEMKNKVIYPQFLAEVYMFASDQDWPDAFPVGTFKAKYYTNQLI